MDFNKKYCSKKAIQPLSTHQRYTEKIPESKLAFLGWIKYTHFLASLKSNIFLSYFKLLLNFLPSSHLDLKRISFPETMFFLCFIRKPAFISMFCFGGKKGGCNFKHQPTNISRPPRNGDNLVLMYRALAWTSRPLRRVPNIPMGLKPATDNGNPQGIHMIPFDGDKGNSGEVAPPFGCFLKPCK